jgi:hypothetical protein
MKAVKRIKAAVNLELVERLISAIDTELKGDMILRHKINELSPSFPWNHRTLANWESAGIGVQESLAAGKFRLYSKSSLLQLVRRRLLGE